ncbi:MAG: GNAT family N-acetyltransferase [Acidimicrobiia bacterium]|nr:GNAT family N-acetyltransferase [Acidimicrobiia bacterium]
MFAPITTPRLVLRAPEPDDVDALFRRRNDPEVARWQNWTLPWPPVSADKIVADTVAMGGPGDGQWWMVTVVEQAGGETVGDLALHLSNGGRTAEIGYTFASAHWGRGYAVEAAEALVAWLFEEQGVSRVAAMLHPANHPSAMVLERTGFVLEGHTRLSFWLGDDNSDDLIYGLTRAGWEAWRARPRHRPAKVRLMEITPETCPVVAGLRTHASQERFVSPMARWFAETLYPPVEDGDPVVPWLRAVEADGELVGIVLLCEPTAHGPRPYLWRLLIDRLHQRRGVADQVLQLIEAQCRAWRATELEVTWRPGRGTPEPFYLARGFEPCNVDTLPDGDEVVEARKRL